jgi:hypothetical protein
MIALYRSFSSLGSLERRRAVEAAALMLLVWGGLRLLPFAALRRLVDGYVRAGAAAPRLPTRARIRPAVQRVVRGLGVRLPCARNCLVQALVADAMLRRNGLAAALRIGVLRTDGSAMEAHAWVECDGEIVVGAIDRLSSFRGSRLERAHGRGRLG